MCHYKMCSNCKVEAGQVYCNNTLQLINEGNASVTESTGRGHCWRGGGGGGECRPSSPPVLPTTSKVQSGVRVL